MGWAARANKMVGARKRFADSHLTVPKPDPILTKLVMRTHRAPSPALGLLAVMAHGAVPAPKPPRPKFRPPRKR